MKQLPKNILNILMKIKDLGYFDLKIGSGRLPSSEKLASIQLPVLYQKNPILKMVWTIFAKIMDKGYKSTKNLICLVAIFRKIRIHKITSFSLRSNITKFAFLRFGALTSSVKFQNGIFELRIRFDSFEKFVLTQ